MHAGPIYENRVFVEPDSLADFEAWIAARILEASDIPGVVDINPFTFATVEAGLHGRAFVPVPVRQ